MFPIKHRNLRTMEVWMWNWNYFNLQLKINSHLHFGAFSSRLSKVIRIFMHHITLFLRFKTCWNKLAHFCVQPLCYMQRCISCSIVKLQAGECSSKWKSKRKEKHRQTYCLTWSKSTFIYINKRFTNNLQLHAQSCISRKIHQMSFYNFRLQIQDVRFSSCKLNYVSARENWFMSVWGKRSGRKRCWNEKYR